MFIGEPKTLWLSIGQAIWQLQTLEYAIAYHLIITKVVPGDRESAYRELEKSFRATMGNLIRKLKENIHVHPEIEGRLQHLTEERNWLAHRIFRLHHADFNNIDKFSELIHRVDTLADESLNLAKELAELCRKYCLAIGINEKELDAEIQRQFTKPWTA